MARRIVNECDLSKREFDAKNAVTISLKSKNKKSRSYELSPESAEALEKALVSRESHSIIPEDPQRLYRESEQKTNKQPQTVGDLMEEDDDALVARKQKEREDFRKELPETDKDNSKESAKKTCSHMNKSRPTIATKKGKRGFWVKCLDCGIERPAASVSDREAFMSEDVPEGVRVKE